jgi:hypothetical protein
MGNIIEFYSPQLDDVQGEIMSLIFQVRRLEKRALSAGYDEAARFLGCASLSMIDAMAPRKEAPEET